jgi:hypothetical protein
MIDNYVKRYTARKSIVLELDYHGIIQGKFDGNLCEALSHSIPEISWKIWQFEWWPMDFSLDREYFDWISGNFHEFPRNVHEISREIEYGRS